MESLVESHKLQTRDLRKSGDVGICPIFRSHLARLGERTEGELDSGWFLNVSGVAVFEPVIIEIPSFRLRKDLVAHNGSGREQAKESQLSQSTKAKLRIGGHRVQPRSCSGVVFVPSIGQRDPNVHVREKE